MDLEPLNVGFGGLFLKLWMVPFFSVGSVQLVTGIQLLSGHGTLPYRTAPFMAPPLYRAVRYFLFVPYSTVLPYRTVRYGTILVTVPYRTVR